MLYSIVAMLVVILDQAVKYWVTNTLMGYDIVKFIPGVISLVNVPNDGAAFSMLSGGGARIYFIIVTVVFCVAVILALATNFISGRVARWSLVMVAAGGFANCIDRVIYGYVVDMFKVELFNFAIFNVADIFITVFAIVFALAIIFEKPQKDEDDEDDYDDEEDDGEYKYTKYTDDGGNIVKVTYENGTFFILNYNFFDVTVVLDGTTYTIARNGGVKVTPDGNSVYFTAND